MRAHHFYEVFAQFQEVFRGQSEAWLPNTSLTSLAFFINFLKTIFITETHNSNVNISTNTCRSRILCWCTVFLQLLDKLGWGSKLFWLFCAITPYRYATAAADNPHPFSLDQGIFSGINFCILHVKAANLILRHMVKTPSNYLHLDIQTSLLPGSLYFLAQTFQSRIGNVEILGDSFVPVFYHSLVNHVQS